MSTTLKQLREEHAAELASLKSIAEGAPAGKEFTSEQLAQFEVHKKNVDRLKIEIGKERDAIEIKSALDAIGINLGLDGDETSADFREKHKNLIVERSKAGYKRSASAQWALKAAERISTTMSLLGGSKALLGTQVVVPEIITGPVNLPEERSTILNLIPTQAATGKSTGGNGGNVFGYSVQTVRTNNANAVVDGALKPTSVYTWEDRVDRFRVIAHLSEPMPERVLEDLNELRQILTDEMGAGVLDEIEGQILTGTGTIAATADGTPTTAEEQLPGILNTSGIRAQAWTTDLLTTLAAAWDTMEIVKEVPNAWVLHPLDYRRLTMMREDGVTGPLMFKSGRSSIEQVLGDVPVVTSTLMTQGVGLLGDFTKTRLLVREEVKVESNNRDSTLFDYNLMKLRAEGRYGFAVLRPGAFIQVDLTSV